MPWRKTSDPYKILVSEIMLQQTQVERVLPFYAEFMKRFPTIQKLAKATLGDVLRAWQGLGYNRRARMLHEATKKIMIYHNGRLPRSHAELVALPGVGAYTASAIRVFAWNQPDVMIETNIRTAFIHHFFLKKKQVYDSEILPILRKTIPTDAAREWYSALMDYGSYLKKNNPNPSRKSAHHIKQKPFKGSNREVRGAILRVLSKESITFQDFSRDLPFRKKILQKNTHALSKEGLLKISKGRISLP